MQGFKSEPGVGTGGGIIPARSGSKRSSSRKEVKGPLSPLGPGARAPDFGLPGSSNQKISLRGLQGAPVILVFYPADWSPVCTDQLGLYNEVLPEFERYGAHLVGISVDGVWSHQAFARERKLRFPLLSDFEPKGRTSRAYGVYRERGGVSKRALFVIDAGGKIRWSHVSPDEVNPGADGILAALDGLQGKGEDR